MHSHQQGRRGIRPASSRPRPLPPGMGTVLCKFYPSGACTRGESCLYRHTTSPDKKSSAASKNFAAHRCVQHPQTAGAAPSTPSPSRQGVAALPIPSGGRGGAIAPAQLTPIIKSSTSRDHGGHGQTVSAAGTPNNGAVKDDGSARKSCPTSAAPKKRGGNGKMLSSRRSTSPVKKYRRGLNKASGAAATSSGQPDKSHWAAASGQTNMNMDNKIGRENVPSRPSDEDLTKPVAVQGGIPTATNTNATGTTNTNTNVGDEMTMIRADDQEGVTVVGDDPSADCHNGTNHDDNRVPQAPTFNPKPSSKGNRDDDEDEEEQQDDFLAQYWHENIQMSIFTHEDVAEILKKSGKAVAIPRRGREMHSSVKGEKAHKQPMPDDDDDDDARSNSKDGTTSINVDNNVSNKGTVEPSGNKGTDKNGTNKGGVTDAMGGTGTAEQEDAKNDQDKNINKKAIVVRYDVETVDPKRKRCRCFYPPGITWAKIDLPCPSFDNCPLSFCPYEHKTKESFEKRMAERGSSMDDLVLGVHDEKSHVPDDYNGEEGRVPPRVEVDIVNVLCEITSPPGVYTYPPSSGDTIVLCQPISSADTYAEGATTSLATSSNVEDDEINASDCVADLYCYDEDGEFQFLVPPSIPNETRTKEILLFEDSEAYTRESFKRSWNYKMPGGGEPESKANICNRAANSEDPSVNAGVGVVGPLSNKRKSSRTLALQGHRKGGRKPKEGKKTKKFSTVVSDKRSPFKQPQKSKTGTKLNPSATEFVPSTPTSTTKTAVVHIDVEDGKRPICTPVRKSDANSTPARYSSIETPSDGDTCSRSEIKDDQKSLDDTKTGTGTANSKGTISIPILSGDSKGTASNIPAQIDARGTSTDKCPSEPLVSKVKTSAAAPNGTSMGKNTDPTPTVNTSNAADTTGASEVAAPSLPQDKDVPGTRERSGAFDLSHNVSPPAPSWSSPTRFQGSDKEVLVAIRKSDRELNFLAAMKSKPKKLDHPDECDLPTSTTCTSTPANSHDKKKKKKRSGDTPSSKLGVSQGKVSNRNSTKIIDDKKNAADAIVSQEPRSQSKSSKSTFKPESSNGIKKKVEATTMATPATSVSSDSLSGPSNLSSSNSSTNAIPAEHSVDNCVKQMEEIGFSSSVISQTETEFRSKKPGSWTEENLFSLACYLSKQEELNNADLEEQSLNEQNETISGRSTSRAQLEGGVEKTKDINPEDDLMKQSVDEKKGATKKKKAAAKNRRRKKNKAKKASKLKANTTPSSEPDTTPSEGGEDTREKHGGQVPKKELENSTEQDSKTPTSPEILEATGSGDRIDKSTTEPSPEAKKRFRFWSAEQFHRDLYTKNLFRLISCEYSRLNHCENPEDISSNDVIVEPFMKECTRVYENLYKYRTGTKSTVMVADDHPTLAGRSGRIVASDITKHEFEVEFHRSKIEKIVNKANTMSGVDDDDTYDLLDVDEASSSFTRLKISAYDLAAPEIASRKGKARSNKKAKNNKSVAQSLRPAQWTLNIEEDEANNIHGFGMVVKASTLNELAGLKDSEILTQRLSEIMKERDEQEEAAKALEEMKEQTKIREAEEQEKQEIFKRFQQYEREIKGRRKKARRILSSGKSKFVKALRTKPETPEKLYFDSGSPTSSVYNGYIDVLVTLHEREDDQEAHDLIEAMRGAELPTTVEYDESSETTRTCCLFEDDNHKIPLCVFDHELDMSDFTKTLLLTEEDVDSLVRTIMEPVQFDELCSETGLRKSDAFIFVQTLIHIEENTGPNITIPLRIVKRFVKSDVLDKGFANKVLSRDEGGPDQTRLILRAASQRLSKRLSFDLSDLVRKLVHKMEREGEQASSDSDQDSDDSDSVERGTDYIRRLSNFIDSSVFEKFCKVTGLNETDAVLFFGDYLVFMHGREAVAPELDKLPDRFLGKLVKSGFLDQDFVTKVVVASGGFMSSELIFTLVNSILEKRCMFSLSDLVLVDLAPRLFDFGIAGSQAECHRALDVSEESELQLDGESIFFIEELPSDEKVTEADDVTDEDDPDEDSNTDDNIGDDEDDSDDGDGDDDETDVGSDVDINEEEDIDDDELTDAGIGNDEESSEYFVSSSQSEAAV